MISLRPYQSRTVQDLFEWWTKHQGDDDVPILALPTAAGKSIIIAEIVRTMYYQFPDYHPRTVVIVPSRELAQQNAEKLVTLLPAHISVGYVSASLGTKKHMSDVIVATIGSIYKDAHLLGDIKMVLIDECHLCSPKGDDAGMYRKFLTDLSRYCNFRTAGTTATPFRGNGVWLTDGDKPLFTGIASTVTMRELLDAGFIAHLVPPGRSLLTRIDASTVGIVNGDYKVGELTDCVNQYLGDVARETVQLAQGRNKWIAFTPSVENAQTLSDEFNCLGVGCAVVCGETPKQERIELIADFRAGRLQCLVTVLALSTGFDVPDVDCIIWCRPTKSPVLYLQGLGRGMRISPGKTDCMVLDFSDTVERIGPVDLVKGKAKTKGKGEAPYCVCDECGARNHAAALECAECGAWIKDAPKPVLDPNASRAAVLSMQQQSIITWHEVTRVDYAVHSKPDKPDSLRVDYFAGLLKVASEWACFDHSGYARQKACEWSNKRVNKSCMHLSRPPLSTKEAFELASMNSYYLKPTRIATRQNGKFTEIVDHQFN